MKVFEDHRGSLTVGVGYTQFFVAHNIHSYTLRGLHFQSNPLQTKTVKILSGSVIDFLYNQDTGEVLEFNLTTESKPLVIGKEYAHGYLTLQPNTIMVYGVEGEYNADTYKTVSWKSVEAVRKKVLSLVEEHNIIISDKDNI